MLDSRGSRPESSGTVVRLLTLLIFLIPGLLAVPLEVRADDLDARDMVYEAADAIDQAVEELRQGRQTEADRLLTTAEEFLDRAERLDPSLSRVTYERARLYKVDDQPDVAEALLLGAMTERLEISDHVQAVELLDDIRADLELPTIGEEWRRATAARDLGVGMLIGGAIASIVGYGIGFQSLAGATYQQQEVDVLQQRVGLGIAAGGGGVALGGGFVMIGGQVKVRRLEAILPGPWRLRGAERRSAKRR
jgi:hypothetical protein